MVGPQHEDAGLEVIEADRRPQHGGAGPGLWSALACAGTEAWSPGIIRMKTAFWICLLPERCLGAHQIQNAGAALAALRHLGADEAACEAAMTNAEWPARMQRLKTGPLVEARR